MAVSLAEYWPEHAPQIATKLLKRCVRFRERRFDDPEDIAFRYLFVGKFPLEAPPCS
jgi:hypothetical protein